MPSVFKFQLVTLEAILSVTHISYLKKKKKTNKQTSGSNRSGFYFSSNNNIGVSRALASTHITISPKDSVFTLPYWRPSTNSNNIDSSKKNEQRSKELRLNDAFLSFETMVLDKGQKPDAAQATQLLNDLGKANKLRKAVRVMEMMVSSHY
ncbi:hypothetical protein TIFTF001_055006 [Ficus carica]|uniref:Pentatricopeptide repeat-containing protein n=1 Tax=Ficus carica TaxID=3494 RepID=A0AA88EP60_FICCA|nr:hypothetical protein TIFTF001_055006 [Ficus carica]